MYAGSKGCVREHCTKATDHPVLKADSNKLYLRISELLSLKCFLARRYIIGMNKFKSISAYHFIDHHTRVHFSQKERRRL